MTEQELKDIADRMLREGYGETIVNNTYGRLLPEVPNLEITDSDFRTEMKITRDMMQQDEEFRQQTIEYEKEREEKLRRERSESPTLAAELQNYLVHTRNCKAVSARELADAVYNKLDDIEKKYYFNRPLFAAKELLDTDLFNDCLRECIRKYQESKTIQKKINDYLDKVAPNRESNDYEIDKLISMLPESRKTLDDRNYQAYTAICWLEDKENETSEPVTAEEITSDSEANKEFVATVAAEIQNGEPYGVAYRSGLEHATSIICKKIGQVRSYPAHVVDVVQKSLELGDRETLGDNLYDKVKRDEEIAALLREKERMYQTRYTAPQRQYKQPATRNNFGLIAGNIIFIILLFVARRAFNVQTFPMTLGFLIATLGLVIEPESRDRTRATALTFIGYAIVILAAILRLR